MKLLTDLQHRFGFTGNEIRVILLLSLALLAGMGIRWLRSNGQAPGGTLPAFDYARSDSEFAAISSAFPPDSSVRKGNARSHLHPGKPHLSPGSVDVNRAPLNELLLLPGIGDSLAHRIIAYRDRHGPFPSIDELMNVGGIGPKKLDKMRPFVTAGRHVD